MSGNPELEQKLRDVFARDEVPPGLFDRVERALAGSEVTGPATATSDPQVLRNDPRMMPSRQTPAPLARLWLGLAVSGWAVAALLVGMIVVPRPYPWQTLESPGQGERDGARFSAGNEADQASRNLSPPLGDNTLKVGPGESLRGQAEESDGGYRSVAFHPDQGVLHYTGLFPADFDTEGDHEQLPPLAGRIFGERLEFAPAIPEDVLTSYAPGEGRLLTWNGRPAVAVDLVPRGASDSSAASERVPASQGARLFIVLAEDSESSFFGRVPTESPASFEWRGADAVGTHIARSGRLWREGRFVYVIVDRD